MIPRARTAQNSPRPTSTRPKRTTRSHSFSTPTPYESPVSSPGGYSSMLPAYGRNDFEGYIFFSSDIRAATDPLRQIRHASSLFTMAARPPVIDEATALRPSLAVKNVPQHGRVGIDAFPMTATSSRRWHDHPHPALNPRASLLHGRTWARRRFFHNGAFRLSYAFEYGRAARNLGRKSVSRSIVSIFYALYLPARPAFGPPPQNISTTNPQLNVSSSHLRATNLYWEASRHHAFD